MTEKGSKVPQFLTFATALLLVIGTGATLGWTSPVLPELERTGGPLGSPISSEQSSWIGSLEPIGSIFGTFITGFIGERWGRKQILLSSVMPLLIGWILIATASHIAQIYVARFVFGLAIAIPFTTLPMYCGEIAETSVRGALGSLITPFVTTGILYSYAIGPFVSYVVFSILCAILPVIFFVCFMRMPESPYFLLIKGRRDEAIASLARLRGKSEAAVQKEADEIQMTLDKAFKNQIGISNLFKVKVNLKVLMYACVLLSFQQLTGINVVLFYMQNIFIAAGDFVPMEIAPIIIEIIQVLASLMILVIVDRSGRKMLLISSGIVETASLCALGLYFYLKEVQHADDVVAQISWVPMVSLIIYIVAFSMGWGSVPWIILSEMFAPNIKVIATSITIFVCRVFAFVVTKFSINLEEVFNGKYAIFWVFGGFCILSVFFTILLLPETKGKTLQQIQDELNGVKLTVKENRT